MSDRLHGFWALASYTERRGGTYVDALVPDAKGFITYTPGGEMSVLITGNQRRLRGAWSSITDADKAANYEALVAYAGRYEDLGERVHHKVEVCWIPNWVGRVLIRAVHLPTLDRLELRTVPDDTGAMPLDQIVVWERQSRF